MGHEIKNILRPSDNWVVEVIGEDDQPDMPQYLDSTQPDADSNNHTFKIPQTIGILPIRNTVVYPGTVTPLAIGRDKSKQLIATIVPNQTIIGLVTQQKPDIEQPTFEDLYTVGTAASILKIIKMPQGSMHVIVHGMARFRIVKPVTTQPYLQAQVESLEVKTKITRKVQALMVSIRNTANRVIALSPNVPEEASVLLENIENPSALADFLAANLGLPIPQKQALLEELDATKRLEQVSLALANQLELLELSNKIQGKVKESVDKNQREYFLQEQLKAIQTELGQYDRKTEEIKLLKDNIKKARMPKKIEDETLRELDRLSNIPPASPEYTVIRTFLDLICELPWSIETTDRLDINKAQKILNQDHYNLTKVKKRILEFLAVRKLNPKGKSPILCFVGPPASEKLRLANR